MSKIEVGNPHEAPFGEVDLNLWECGNVIDALWAQLRDLEKAKSEEIPQGFDLEAFKVTIRKMQNLEHALKAKKRALAYRARPFAQEQKQPKVG